MIQLNMTGFKKNQSHLSIHCIRPNHFTTPRSINLDVIDTNFYFEFATVFFLKPITWSIGNCMFGCDWFFKIVFYNHKSDILKDSAAAKCNHQFVTVFY